MFKTNWNEYESKIKPLFVDENVLTCKSLENAVNDIEEVKVNQVVDEPNSTQLKEENERLKHERLCVICLTKDKNVLFLPCAHLAACLECSFNMRNCPMCRSKIQATVRTYN